MEVQLTPDVQAKLDQMAKATGRRSDELLQDAVIGFFDELAFTREMLERRYRDLETGRVQSVEGEDALPSPDGENRRTPPPSRMSGFALHPEAYDDIDQIRAYIAGDNPDAADRMLNEVFDRIRLLAQLPNQGLRSVKPLMSTPGKTPSMH